MGVAENNKLLEVKNLSVAFDTDQGTVYAVRDVSFDLAPGEILGIVGESGSGKSVTMYAIMGLLAANTRSVTGDVIFDNQDISRAHFTSEREYNRTMQKLRGKKLSMIFQDPMTFLNPVLTIEKQLIEPILNHTHMDRGQARLWALDLMKQVGVPGEFLHRYPHQFSGGQRQRIGIARAIALQPSLLICDEPVSALDVSVQSQVLNLLKRLQKELSLTYLFIGHDLSVINFIADRVCVMFLGRICEIGTRDQIYDSPLHPYTEFLLEAIPQADPHLRNENKRLLTGEIPSPVSPPSGCHFHTRCPYATERCRTEVPVMRDMGDGHMAACHRV